MYAVDTTLLATFGAPIAFTQCDKSGGRLILNLKGLLLTR